MVLILRFSLSADEHNCQPSAAKTSSIKDIIVIFNNSITFQHLDKPGCTYLKRQVQSWSHQVMFPLLQFSLLHPKRTTFLGEINKMQ